jgi:hypothetical protein
MENDDSDGCIPASCVEQLANRTSAATAAGNSLFGACGFFIFIYPDK